MLSTHGIIYLQTKDMKNNGIKPSQMGYGIKGGRLIRTAPCPDMGITEMVRMKKAMKRAEKISMIAEGYAMGEMMYKGTEGY